MDTLKEVAGGASSSNSMQQFLSSFTWNRVAACYLVQVLMDLAGNGAQVASFFHERAHHLQQTYPGVERAQAIPELESPAACTTPQPADS
jgi:hypothetical protein